ncbi:peptidoglycan-binding protein [Microbacteriaceae bacterium]|nr:peptidoglycan-binding protein [Candidatus Saccharibacteria bacterium]
MKGPMITVSSYSGYSPNLALDGSFGPATHAVTYKYQRHYELKYDGFVGPQTWRQLCNPDVAPSLEVVHMHVHLTTHVVLPAR